MASKRRPPAVDIAALFERARAAITQNGSVAKRALGPKSAQAELVSRLRAAGFEEAQSWVRVRLAEQLRARMAEGSFLALSTIEKRLAGANKVEAKRAALAFLAQGQARLVLRGSELTIVPASVDVIEPRALERLSKLLSRVSKKPVKGQPAPALLRRDLEELFPRAARHPSPATDLVARVVAEVDRATEPGLGLAFIPHVVAQLAPDIDLAAAKRALRDAANAGAIELRPEGGIGRLAPDEVAACLEGPSGTTLSWARRLSAAAP